MVKKNLVSVEYKFFFSKKHLTGQNIYYLSKKLDIVNYKNLLKILNSN